MTDNIMSVNTADAAYKIDSVKPADRLSEAEEKETEKVSENHDEYVPSEEKEQIGLYSVSSDENGNPKVEYDKAAEPSEKSEERPKAVTTANTDNVDREIKNLRDKAQMLSQKLRSADEGTAADIQREYEQVIAELAQKDNDEYRRQNTVFT